MGNLADNNHMQNDSNSDILTCNSGKMDSETDRDWDYDSSNAYHRSTGETLGGTMGECWTPPQKRGHGTVTTSQNQAKNS